MAATRRSSSRTRATSQACASCPASRGASAMRPVEGGDPRDRVSGRGAAPGPQRVPAGRALSLGPQRDPPPRGQVVQVEHPPERRDRRPGLQRARERRPGRPFQRVELETRSARPRCARPAACRSSAVPRPARRRAACTTSSSEARCRFSRYGRPSSVPAARLTRLVPGQPRFPRVLGPAQGQPARERAAATWGPERVISRQAAEVDLVAGAHRGAVRPGDRTARPSWVQ